jgi:antitoxin (DNA-binding transcriptional repressor) of toxin-antitoxin stability system
VTLPKLDFTGEEAEVTMTEFRSEPGELIDRVRRGLTVHITKNGQRVATMKASDPIIHSDGHIEGAKPLTFGIDLGGEYAGHA